MQYCRFDLLLVVNNEHNFSDKNTYDDNQLDREVIPRLLPGVTPLGNSVCGVNDVGITAP
jgi:hypothetical protein